VSSSGFCPIKCAKGDSNSFVELYHQQTLSEHYPLRLFVGVECEELFRDDGVQLSPASTEKFRSASFSLLAFFHLEIIQIGQTLDCPFHLVKAFYEAFPLMRQNGLLLKGGQNKLLVSNDLL